MNAYPPREETYTLSKNEVEWAIIYLEDASRRVTRFRSDPLKEVLHALRNAQVIVIKDR